MRHKRVLITGITGFLGHSFLLTLRGLSETFELYGLSRHASQSHGFQAICCDLVDRNATARAIAELQPYYIFHLAGVAHSDDWDELLDGNVQTTISLLEAVRSAGLQQTRLIVVGSASEYGIVPANQLPVVEEIRPNPVSRYGASMVARTAVALAYHHLGLDILVARVFNTLGSGLPEHLSIGSFAKQIAEIEQGRKEPVLLTGQLSSKRDFLDISDISKAIYLLALHGRSGEIYNVCSGRSFAIKTILKLCLQSTDKDIGVEVAPARVRSIDIPDLYGNNEKLIRDTGWESLVSIDESVKRTLQFWREAST
jgi:GDP-4-dehydro-6-deoxy-D-mannose reductase